MPPFLQLRQASVVRGGQAILKNLSLAIGLGEQVAIIGPNGAGKSTLLKMLSGDIYPLHRAQPAIRLFGQARWDLFSLRSRLAVISPALLEQQQRQPDCPGLHLILSGLFGSIGLRANQQISSAQKKQARQIAQELGLSKLLAQTVGSLSSGELRRFLIGRALINNPQIIVLDEPTVSLDIKARTQFLQNIRHLARNGRSIIMVTHLLEEIIPEITRVIILQNGRILADGEKDQILRSSLLSKTFHLPLRVEKNNGYYSLSLKP
ncbi:molybdenum ABC transporter ATP-binding protein [Candidatus Termititenax persephonae]|uniref:Molybdenum ABC transporter ATP-binding protein n=1 Tax=Candidatus Termititenax persephonae TaxID=2218525 RepID=A0A388TF39_9BACT|nr:molybdenum ABC transporter ATP-binding protein [Candidatus Termititenax persephonae]